MFRAFKISKVLKVLTEERAVSDIHVVREDFLEEVAVELGRQDREVRPLGEDSTGRGSSPMEAEMVECVGRLRRRVLWLERKAGTRSWRALNARLEGLSFLLREVLDPGRV